MSQVDSTTAQAPRSIQLHCRRCGRFLPTAYTIHRARLCDLCDSRLAAGALRSAAETLTFARSGGVRQSVCPFLRSHRDGTCDRCLQMAAHDANLPRWVA